MGKPDEALADIAKKHLSLIAKYNPYRNFPGVKNREDFASLIDRDPAFSYLGLKDSRYIIARIGGNLITSLHRKVGDMYEEMFKYLLVRKYAVQEEDLSFSVLVKIGARVQERSTDGLIRVDLFRRAGVELNELLPGIGKWDGVAFEVRSCYQIGDSKRIQADYDMALALKAIKIFPIMLIFCSTSLRSPVIRLSKSWHVLQGRQTFDFLTKLVGFDLARFLTKNSAEFSALMETAFAKL